MIDLYAAATSNSVRARMALEECGLAYKFHPIDLSKGEQKTAQFLAMNPMGQVPVIVDPEGPGGKPVTLSQSTAILLYAAEKSGKLQPKDPAKRPAFLQALMNASTDITPNFGALNAVKTSKEPHAPTLELFKSRQKGMFKIWDDLLAGHKYAGGDEYTIADISLYAGYWRTKGAFPECVEGLKNLERWGAEMAARPGIQRGTKF